MDIKHTPTTVENLDVKSLRHPSERSRFILATIISVPLFLFITIPLYIIVGLEVWFAVRILRASLTGHHVKISRYNFPEIDDLLEDIKSKLDYRGKVDIFIMEEGGVNAMLISLFRTKYIALFSGLAESIDTHDGKKQLEFIIGRFVGALKAKHSRFIILRIATASLQRLKLFNLLLLPYERATQYSGDQIGLAICQDLENAVNALARTMVGNKLYKKLNPSSVTIQAQEVRGFWGFLARLFSSHPHMVHRYMNLLSFARSRYPVLYERYLSSLDDSKKHQLELAMEQAHFHH